MMNPGMMIVNGITIVNPVQMANVKIWHMMRETMNWMKKAIEKKAMMIEKKAMMSVWGRNRVCI